MAHELVPEIRQLLIAFASLQKNLVTIYEQKLSAMRASDLTTLNRTLNEENQCNLEFQELMRTRKELLLHANSFFPGVKTLEELIDRIGGENRDELLGMVKEMKSRTTDLRSRSWVHWIVARRGFQHYSQILELIANCGKTSPTYDRTNPLVHSGGAILDTSV